METSVLHLSRLRALGGLLSGDDLVVHPALQSSRFVAMDHTFRSCLVQQPSGLARQILGMLKLVGGNRFPETAQRMTQASFIGPIPLATNNTLSQTLLGALGVWHFDILLH